MQRRRNRTVALCLTMLLCGSPAPLCAAGPLDPPPGPVAPTGKTMILSLPYTISTPGSYELARSLTGTGNTSGITITASNVTLDLGGHRLAGTGTSTSGTGIVVAAGASRLTIRNGTVTAWGGRGIDATQATHCRIERLLVINNAATLFGGSASGVEVGDFSAVEGCTVMGHRVGILCGARSRVSSCLVDSFNDGSTAPAITVGDNSEVSSCLASASAIGLGGYAITAGNGCTVTDCRTTRIWGPQGNMSGIRVGNGCTVSGCAASAPEGLGSNGIRGGTACNVTGCTVEGRYISAFTFDEGSTITACSANSTFNGGTGYSVGGRSLVDRCTAAGQFTNGVTAGNGSTVRQCTLTGSGIRIDAAVSGCRIEENQIDVPTAGIAGITVSGTRNIVLRNTVHGDAAAYSIAPGNSAGPIVNVTGVGDIGATAGANHPWANFRY